MSLTQKKQHAIRLRKAGLSYNEIRKKIGASKGTLSYWLRDYPLSTERLTELRSNEKKIEKFRNTMRAKKQKRLSDTYKKQKNILLPLNNRELLLAGLFLYWGEGTKSRMESASLSNTDPAMILFF